MRFQLIIGRKSIVMLESWKIIVMLFYLQKQTLATDKLSTAIDKMINVSLDGSVQPCEDFYAYACGHYNSNSLLELANHQYNLAIIKLLETYGRLEQQVGGNCPALAEKVRNYFVSCRQLTNRNLTRYLEELKPGPHLNWPVLENSSQHPSNWPHDKDFDVLHLLGRLRSLGVSNVILQSSDLRSIKENGIYIQAATFQSLSAVKATMLDLLSSMAVTNPTKILEDVLETDNLLRNLHAAHEHKVQEQKVEISLGDLMKRFPNLNFEAYFREYTGLLWPLNTSATLRNPSFFQDLNDKLGLSFDRTKLCHYLMLHYLLLVGATTEFNSTFCAYDVRKMFNLAINFVYHDHNVESLEQLVKPDVKDMFRTIVDVLRKHFQRSEVKLTVQQVESVMESLASVRLNIGNLPDNATCQRIEELYASVPPLKADNYYKNHLLMLRFMEPRSLQAHFQATGFGMPGTPGIIYNPTTETITLNYAYLMPPLYDFEYNNLAKYSLLGYMLAQKVVEHCKIIVLDLRNQSKYFQTTLKCLEVDPIYDFAFSADRVENNVAAEVVRKIVTLKFYNLQPIESVAFWKRHFYLNVAQHYCSQDEGQTALRDSGSNRLNRIGRNMQGFAQAYDCPEGSQMNPSEKCQI